MNPSVRCNTELVRKNPDMSNKRGQKRKPVHS